MFFAFPYRVCGSSLSTCIPLANGLIIVANVLAFALGFSAHWYVGPGTGLASVVTYAFSHSGLWHLAGNMWVLLVFGTPVNRRLGNVWYTVVYLGTVLTLGVFVRLVCGGYLMGASAAIFAIVAVFLCLMPGSSIDLAYLAIFPLSLLFGLFHRPEHWVYWFIRWDTFSVRAVWAIALVPLIEFWGLYWWGWNWTNVGHLLGLACGLAAVLLVPTEITMNRRRMAWE